MKRDLFFLLILVAVLLFLGFSFLSPDVPVATDRAYIDDTSPGWETLEPDDFAPVNGEADTWRWENGILASTGEPIGVYRTRETFKNFEMVIEWQHQQAAGNSGMFAWVPRSALDTLVAGELPKQGIEIQMLDHGYTTWYESTSGNTADWFSTNGDIFPVGQSSLTPLPPTSPNGVRSFPRSNRSRGHGEWNHYYVRAINGEVRLWVNGEEVSGGNNASPAMGHLCLEAEGAPILFRKLRIRRLP
ncbi:MAG: DUF1080 domain-containing protein [Bacteroidota bacterium]